MASEVREWNAEVYHRVSEPQFNWGMAVLARLELAGDESILDAGCGSGRLSAELAGRLPRGRLIAVDRSLNMVAKARSELSARASGRFLCLASELGELAVEEGADGIFSTATFHWVLDHPRLFRSLWRALRPGGWLEAQCGGGPNLARIHAHCERLISGARFREFFGSFREPWQFADPETTVRRLAEAGFVEARAWLEEAPARFPDRGSFIEFVSHVVLRPYLALLPEASLREEFVNAVAVAAAADDPPFTLDYWRLNFRARKT